MRQVATEAGVAVMTVTYTYTRPERVAAATRTRVLDRSNRPPGATCLGADLRRHA
jgi:DNA-binding LacI/PurR family transcriptional regulator